MTITRNDRDIRELLERTSRLEKKLASAEERETRLKADVDMLTKYLDKLIHAHANALDSVTDRLSILEDKVYPSMGPMLDGIQKIVGGFSGWTLNNPLDRRKNGP